jgi:osmotically-inducible protein OsmY
LKDAQKEVLTVATTAAMSTRSDDSFRDDVLSELALDPKITSGDITVAIKDRVVALSGFASSYWEKEEAEKVPLSV